MTTSNCNPCTPEPAGGGGTIVLASKYVAVRDINGNTHSLRGDPNSVLVNEGTGSKPVKWRDGSNGQRICLSKLESSEKSATTLLAQDGSGFVFAAKPDPQNGKQQLVFEAGLIGWEGYRAGQAWFNSDDLVAQSGCDLQVAALTTCGPEGVQRLVALPGNQCGALHSDGQFKEVNPAGVVQMFGGNPSSVPAGWLLCDGRIVDSATYPALFNIIGYNFGRSGDNFYLPDFRGLVPRGVESRTDGSGRDPDVNGRVALNPGGNTAENVGSYQGDAVQCHSHGFGKVNVTRLTTSAGNPGNTPFQFVHDLTQEDGGPVAQDDSAGCGVEPNVSTETRMKNVHMHFIISVGC